MSNDYTNLYGVPDTSPEPEEAPKPFTLDSSQIDIPAPPVYTPPVGVAPPPRETYIPGPAAPTPQPVKVKKPFSPIPLLLIAGVAFLFLGGVLFLTNTWDVMPNMGRAITLLSASVLAFGANLLAERVFRLQKTGMAFFILGCIFLPLSIGGIGVFSLFGEWFSYTGAGKMLLWTAVCLGVALPTLYGQARYKLTPLAWISLAGFSAAWTFLAQFAATEGLAQFGAVKVTSQIVACSLWAAFGLGFTFLSEWLLQKKQDTPLAKVAVFVLYPLLYVYICLMWSLIDEAAIAACILMLVMAVLFCNKRFGSGTFHAGIFGSIFALIGAAAAIEQLFPEEESTYILHIDFSRLWFVPCFIALVLMAVRFVKQEALSKTYSIAGLIIAAIQLLIGGVAAMFEAKYIPYLYGLLIMSAIFFAIEKKAKLPKDTAYMAVHLGMVFLTVILNADDYSLLYVLLLVLTALALLAEGFLAKRIWPVMTAVAACAGMLIVRLPFLAGKGKTMDALLLGMFAVGFLITVIYAHVTKRILLEKTGAWVLLSFMTVALALTLDILFGGLQIVSWTLVTAYATLLYLLEAAALSSHERTKGTRPFLGFLAGFLGCGATVSFTDMDTVAFGWGGLLLLLLAVFVVTYVRKPVNVIVIPHLLMFFAVTRKMLTGLDADGLTELGMPHAETWSIVFQAAGFALLTVLLAVLGRFLVPEGFCTSKEKTFRMDWPLLAGILPVLSVAFVIDWHPTLLLFLFLTLYSLLYIGRLQHWRIPALLTSLFFCMTILVHNWEDPFGLFVLWHNWEVRTPQLLLYLLPLHLFLFTLLFILPKQLRSGVHIARFVMYCITMLCLLLSSMNFGNVADAIILVVFSFAILGGSFFVKKLRWFTLGFAVLVVMTVRLTWSFWTSLHWGIYLFLAGAVLITIATVFEVRVRRAAEHPDEPKKSMNPFAAWRW